MVASGTKKFIRQRQQLLLLVCLSGGRRGRQKKKKKKNNNNDKNLQPSKHKTPSTFFPSFCKVSENQTDGRNALLKMQKNADNSSFFLLLLPLSPRNEASPKNKKNKNQQNLQQELHSHTSTKTNFKNEKRRKKIQESAKEDRSRLPETVRILFLISRVCAGGFANTRDAQARGETHARTRTQTRSQVARCVATVVSGLNFPLVSDLLTYPTYVRTYLSEFFSYLLLPPIPI